MLVIHGLARFGTLESAGSIIFMEKVKNLVNSMLVEVNPFILLTSKYALYNLCLIVV